MLLVAGAARATAAVAGAGAGAMGIPRAGAAGAGEATVAAAFPCAWAGSAMTGEPNSGVWVGTCLLRMGDTAAGAAVGAAGTAGGAGTAGAAVAVGGGVGAVGAAVCTTVRICVLPLATVLDGPLRRTIWTTLQPGQWMVSPA